MTTAAGAQRKESATKLSAILNGEKMRAALANVLPAHLTPERMTRIVFTQCVKNPQLLECSAESIVACTLQASMLGLEFVGNLAALVPFKGVAQLVIGYDGFAQIAYRSERVAALSMGTVHVDGAVADDFEYELGSQPFLRHRKHPGVRRNAETLTHAYAVANLRDSSVPLLCVLNKAEVEEHRAVSKTGTRPDGPWVLWYAAQAQKTAMRSLAKLLPKAYDLSRAAEIDGAAEVGEQDLSAIIDLTFDASGVATAAAPPPPKLKAAAPRKQATPPPPADDANGMLLLGCPGCGAKFEFRPDGAFPQAGGCSACGIAFTLASASDAPQFRYTEAE